MCHILLIYTVYATYMAELFVVNLNSTTIDASNA
jgi:hypothetical protein